MVAPKPWVPLVSAGVGLQMVTSVLGYLPIVGTVVCWTWCGISAERLYGGTLAFRVAGTPSPSSVNGGMVQALRAVDLETADEIPSTVTDTHPYKPPARREPGFSKHTLPQTSEWTSFVGRAVTPSLHNRVRGRSAGIVVTVIRAVENPLPSMSWNAGNKPLCASERKPASLSG